MGARLTESLGKGCEIVSVLQSHLFLLFYYNQNVDKQRDSQVMFVYPEISNCTPILTAPAFVGMGSFDRYH